MADRKQASIRKSKVEGALSKPISFRLSHEDREVYLKKVKNSGLTQSEFFRQAVLGNRTQLVARQRTSPHRRRLLFVCNKVNNELERIALRANVDYERGALSEATYLQMLDQLQLVSRYLKAALTPLD